MKRLLTLPKMEYHSEISFASVCLDPFKRVFNHLYDKHPAIAMILTFFMVPACLISGIFAIAAVFSLPMLLF